MPIDFVLQQGLSCVFTNCQTYILGLIISYSSELKSIKKLIDPQKFCCKNIYSIAPKLWSCYYTPINFSPQGKTSENAQRIDKF